MEGLPGFCVVTQGRIKQIAAGQGDQVGQAKMVGRAAGQWTSMKSMEAVQQC